MPISRDGAAPLPAPTLPAVTLPSATLPSTTGFRWAPWFVLAFVALLPTVGPAEVVLSLGALTAMAVLAWQRFQGGTRLLSREAWALTTALFLAYWTPQLLSAPDALDGARTWKGVLTDLRYLPFLWLVAMAMASVRGRRIVGVGLGVIVLVWCVDGLVESATGWGLRRVSALAVDVVGERLVAIGNALFDMHRAWVPSNPPLPADRMSGIFGPGNLKLGLIVCSLSPYALEALRERAGPIGWLVGAVLVGVVILLAGARAAWLGYAIVLAVSGWGALRSKAQLSAVLAIGFAVAVAGFAWSPNFRGRIERSIALVTHHDADTASSGRMSLWRTATAMALDHPVNGVGVRSFRIAYPRYAAPDDFFVSKGETALHAHQILLEILTETGLLGLLLWIAGAVLAWRAWSWAPPAARERARVPALALGVTVFPFNTHLAFYSNFWGGVFLLLLALFAGSLLSGDEDERAAGSVPVGDGDVRAPAA
jgi:O-antigen ligase